MNAAGNVHGTEADMKKLFVFLSTVAIVSGMFAETVNLANVTEGKTLADGDIATGRLGSTCKLSIADGATVTLSGVKIQGDPAADCLWAGINCLGDATIVLDSANDVTGYDGNYPGIHVPKGKTLTIRGKGQLTARSNGRGAGIGGGFELDCGDIRIEGGTITAFGGDCSAGIGSGQSAACGNVTIDGGKVTAAGGYRAAGIGSGWKGSCGNVAVGAGIVSVLGKRGEECLNPIGSGKDGTCGAFTTDDSLFVTWGGESYLVKPPRSVVNLNNVKGDTLLRDCDVVVGELSGYYKISIVDGATVKLSGANVSKYANRTHAYKWAGLTCLGDATIIIEGDNYVSGFGYGHPGIYVPKGKTLTIDGDGRLHAQGYFCAAGIGGGEAMDCGNIVINGGKITAVGINDGAGIGGGGHGYGSFPWLSWTSCGDITINGGEITAKGGSWGAGIGGGVICRCGDIRINGGKIDATGSTDDMFDVFVRWRDMIYDKNDFGIGSPGIGAGGFSSCGDIRIDGGEVTARGGRWAAGIGTGNACLNPVSSISRSDARCGKISINGGSVTATGGERAAGIGSGCDGSCGEIKIGKDVVRLLATRGEDCTEAVGAGKGGSCGNVELESGQATANNRIFFKGLLDLTMLRNYEDVSIPDGTVLTGSLNGYIARVSIQNGAHVWLKDATITCINDCNWPGMTCLGNARITLESNNTVRASYEEQPGIFVPAGSTLTIDGTGSLAASAAGSNGYGGAGRGAGIGAGYNTPCGNIVINSGSVTAVGGVKAAGIGGADHEMCGSITVNSGVSFVSATAGSGAPNPIGAGYGSSAGAVTIASGLSSVIDGQTQTIGNLVCNLAKVADDTTLDNGMVVKGTLGGNYELSIADGATITLKDAIVDGVDDSDYKWAGLTCLGDATIVLEGKSSIAGFYESYPGIFVPPGKTLTIKGSGSLTVLGHGYAPGIGGGYKLDGGNIVIESGEVTAVGMDEYTSGGIGGGSNASFGDITVLGGSITVKCSGRAGIGSGYRGSCGNITILGGTINAQSGSSAASIGSGEEASCGDIAIGADVTRIVAAQSSYCNAIGAGEGGECGAVTVAPELSDTGEGEDEDVPRMISTCDLSRIAADTVFADGAVLTGTLDGCLLEQRCKLSVADGATVTLQNARIEGYAGNSCNWAGITCEGSATIVLEGNNFVRGFDDHYPGIFVPAGSGDFGKCTLTIAGDGSLEVYPGKDVWSGKSYAAAIGAGDYTDAAGNIVIEGGYIIATGGEDRSVIGASGALGDTCGDITITGGSGVLTRVDGDLVVAETIGRGNYGTKCGTITVFDEVMKPDDAYRKFSASPLTYPKNVSDITCTITFDAMGGTVPYTSKAVQKDAEAGVLPVPTKKGFKFAGWFTDPEAGEMKNATSLITADIVLYAHWTTGSGSSGTDTGAIAFNFAPSYTADPDGTFSLDVGSLVESDSPPTITVKGLPAGLKYTSTTTMISGKATKSGIFSVTVSAKSKTVKNAVSTIFSLTVPNVVSSSFEAAGLEDVYEAPAGIAPDVSEVVAALVADGWKVSVAGLPSGLKYDAANGALTGVASAEGNFTVTFTATRNKEKETATAVVHVSFPTLMLSVVAWSDPAGSGTVTGGGKYPAQKKTTLKATPAKNCVFAGWCNEDGEPLLGQSDYRSSSFTYITGVEDTKIYAVFATAQEDADSLSVCLTDDKTEQDGTYYLDLGELVTSITIPKLSVKGLPSGLKYDAKTMTISGKATKSGKYKVSVTPTNSSVKKGVEQTFTLTVPNADSSAALPGLLTDTGAYGVVPAGVAFDPWLVDCTPADGWSVKVSGLPAGLKFDAKTFTITGVPTKAGVYTVTFTASKKGEKNQISTITLEIEGLADWAVGTFTGAVFDEGDNVVGHVQSITVSSAGKISGKIIDGGMTWTVAASSFDQYCAGKYTATVTLKSGSTVITDDVEFSDGIAMASDWTAWRNVWKDADRKDEAKTLKNLKIGPAREGTVTFSAPTQAGSVTAKLRDGGYSASMSTTLIPSESGYALFWYFPPKSGKFAGDGGQETVK